MRFITKRFFGGHSLEKAHEQPPQTSGEARTRWGSFVGKDEVATFLEEEQLGLCAYSEVRPDQEEIGTHIEHVKPKGSYPELTFDYSNLVLCGLNESDLKAFSGKAFGGHAKQDKYDPDLFISCLDPDCESYFTYLSNGRIVPSSQEESGEKYRKADYTINTLLNLNSPYLVQLRKSWIDELDELIDQHLDNGDSLAYLAKVYLIPTNDKLYQFFSASRQRFGRISETILESNSQ